MPLGPGGSILRQVPPLKGATGTPCHHGSFTSSTTYLYILCIFAAANEALCIARQSTKINPPMWRSL